MIIGTSTHTEVCQILRQDSKKLTLLKENFLKEDLWSGGRLTKVQATTGPDTVCGLKYEPKLAKPLRREKSKSGLTRSQNSIMLNEREHLLQ